MIFNVLPRRRRGLRATPSTGNRRRRLLSEKLESRNLLAAHFNLQILHASDLEGGVEAIENAPNFAAIVDSFENDPLYTAQFDGSILLSAGDNYIPGPFFSAAGDRAAFRDDGLFNDTYNDLFGRTDYNGLREGSGRPPLPDRRRVAEPHGILHGERRRRRLQKGRHGDRAGCARGKGAGARAKARRQPGDR